MMLPITTEAVIQELLFLLVKEYGNDEKYYWDLDYSIFRLRYRQLKKWFDDQKKVYQKNSNKKES